MTPIQHSATHSLNTVLEYVTLADAASSTNQCNVPGQAGRTRELGRPVSGSSNTVFSTSCFAAPVATNTTRAAWLITGSVSVMRRAGGLGLSSIGATQPVVSLRSAWPGKSEAVCPSGPMPSIITSNTGNRAESFEAKDRMSCDSYSLQQKIHLHERQCCTST
jgi:hypothetical protein